MKIIVRIVLIALAIMVLPSFIPGITVSGFYPALMAALVFGILNLLVKPILSIVTLPINIITLGLFGLVVNGLLLWFVGSFIAGFSVATFTAAFLGALVIAAINWLGHFV